MAPSDRPPVLPDATMLDAAKVIQHGDKTRRIRSKSKLLSRLPQDLRALILRIVIDGSQTTAERWCDAARRAAMRPFMECKGCDLPGASSISTSPQTSSVGLTAAAHYSLATKCIKLFSFEDAQLIIEFSQTVPGRRLLSSHTKTDASLMEEVARFERMASAHFPGLRKRTDHEWAREVLKSLGDGVRVH